MFAEPKALSPIHHRRLVPSGRRTPQTYSSRTSRTSAQASLHHISSHVEKRYSKFGLTHCPISRGTSQQGINFYSLTPGTRVQPQVVMLACYRSRRDEKYSHWCVNSLHGNALKLKYTNSFFAFVFRVPGIRLDGLRSRLRGGECFLWPHVLCCHRSAEVKIHASVFPGTQVIHFNTLDSTSWEMECVLHKSVDICPVLD